MTVEKGTTFLGRFQLWSGIVAILGWIIGSLLVLSNLVGIVSHFLRGGAAPLVLATLWPLGQGILYIGCGEALRRHRRELRSLEPPELERMQRVVVTETRIWQLLVIFVVFNLVAFIGLDLLKVFSRVS